TLVDMRDRKGISVDEKKSIAATIEMYDRISERMQATPRQKTAAPVVPMQAPPSTSPQPQNRDSSTTKLDELKAVVINDLQYIKNESKGMAYQMLVDLIYDVGHANDLGKIKKLLEENKDHILLSNEKKSLTATLDLFDRIYGKITHTTIRRRKAFRAQTDQAPTSGPQSGQPTQPSAAPQRPTKPHPAYIKPSATGQASTYSGKPPANPPPNPPGWPTPQSQQPAPATKSPSSEGSRAATPPPVSGRPPASAPPVSGRPPIFTKHTRPPMPPPAKQPQQARPPGQPIQPKAVTPARTDLPSQASPPSTSPPAGLRKPTPPKGPPPGWKGPLLGQPAPTTPALVGGQPQQRAPQSGQPQRPLPATSGQAPLAQPQRPPTQQGPAAISGQLARARTPSPTGENPRPLPQPGPAPLSGQPTQQRQAAPLSVQPTQQRPQQPSVQGKSTPPPMPPRPVGRPIGSGSSRPPQITPAQQNQLQKTPPGGPPATGKPLAQQPANVSSAVPPDKPKGPDPKPSGTPKL
ncbi:MAG: hypothetical protein ACHQJ6_04715, partial [Candidatus Berkiellales bacterium]